MQGLEGTAMRGSHIGVARVGSRFCGPETNIQEVNNCLQGQMQTAFGIKM